MEMKLNKKQVAAYRRRVFSVLSRRGFSLSGKDIAEIEKRINNGRRYFFFVGRRKENKGSVKRFVKIPVNDTARILLPFRRQIEFAIFFKKRGIIRTRGVVAFNYNPRRGVPFAVMETFPERHARIGFIQDSRGAERLTRREAKSTLQQLFRLHSLNVAMLPPKLRRLLKKAEPGYEAFRKGIMRYLRKMVRPLDSRGKREPFHRVLERRLAIRGIKMKVEDALMQAKPLIMANGNRRLTVVHGDLAPNNLYVFDSGEVELLDLEWVGCFDNRAIALIYDFGNLRARAWNNSKFRQALDLEMLSIFRRRGEPELGAAIVKLATIRSHLKLSGYFEDYPWPKQKKVIQRRRRISTEKDLKKVLD